MRGIEFGGKHDEKKKNDQNEPEVLNFRHQNSIFEILKIENFMFCILYPTKNCVFIGSDSMRFEFGARLGFSWANKWEFSAEKAIKFPDFLKNQLSPKN